MTPVYLGLGSNLGDRAALLRSALDQLIAPDLQLSKVSRLYETEPLGLREQPWFLNLAAEYQTDLSPHQLLCKTKNVEKLMGRERNVANGPRTIDIDILLYGSVILKDEELEIPHPRYKERRFTLAPLVELNPELRDPLTGTLLTDFLNALRGQTARGLGEIVLSS